MNNIKVKELENFNLFQTLKNSGVDLGIFDFISPDKMDLFYKSFYGERFLSKIYTDNTIENVAEIINGFFTTKWNSLLSYIVSKNENLAEYSEKLIETTVDTGDINTDRNSTNSVSAYNDENFVNNDKDVDHTTTTYDNLTKTRTQCIERLNPNDLNVIVNYLTNNFVYDTIFNDINNIITLQIFSFD